MNLADLIAAQPDLMNQHATAAVAEYQKGEKDRTDKAVAEAVATAKAPTVATLDELDSIVPEKMNGRSDLILSLQKSKATAAQAHAAVVEKLNAEVASLTTQLAEAQKQTKTNTALGNEGKGVPAVGFTPANETKAGDFERIVLGIATADKCSIETATGKAVNNPENAAARQDWVARGCPKIKAA